MPPRSKLPQQVLESVSNQSDDFGLSDRPVKRYLPTGCSSLNCVLSDKVNGGWPSGRISNLIGDSDTAKTILGMTALAEAAKNKEFDDYLLIYSDVEESLTSATKSMFGRRMNERVQFLSVQNDDEKQHPPKTIEEWHYHILDLVKEGRPFIEVLDSLDFLSAQADLDKTQEQKKAFEAGKETKGTYQMAKQKHLKQMLREIKGEIGRTDSIIIIISQTIDNIGSMFNPKTVAGGNALEFASRIRAWLSQLETDKVGKRIVGRKIRFKVSKNHITGKLREIPIWVYSGFGVANTKTSIDFLLAEGTWKSLGGWVIPEGLSDNKYQVRSLIDHIETNKLHKRLDRLVQKTWDRIEESLRITWERAYE
jgi:RecA/RadA recombinase